MLITALEKADEYTRRELLDWIAAKDYVPTSKIEAVTAIYNKEEVGAMCLQKIDAYYEEAKMLLQKVAVEDSLKQNLMNFTLKLMGRKR